LYLAKRIDPSADWIARNSGDPGRGGLLYTEGLFQRMPAAIDPAVVAAEHEGDAWWVVLRTTLLHGDLRDEHIGFDDSTLIALDWGAATQGHPVLGPRLVHGPRRVADRGHTRRSRRGLSPLAGRARRPAAVDLLGLLGLMMYGWIFGLCAVVHTDPAERRWAREELVVVIVTILMVVGMILITPPGGVDTCHPPAEPPGINDVVASTPTATQPALP
jgi:hypothetical protein